MATFQGFQCEFINPVPDHLYCKKCTLVARTLHVTECCGESFCQTCIADTREQGQPCPVCGEKEFATFKHVKNQKQICALQIYCSMKERGCVWSGTLDQLNTHLDPHLDNCQYVDTKCPLNCLQAIPKNEADHHVAQECTKRPHVCQHCGFKSTYEEVVDIHLPDCKYVPLQCPNMCGVSCDREVMDHHMKICRLEEVECEFSSVGCDGRFIREDQDEHARQNSQKHLTLTASLAVETKQQLQEKSPEQENRRVMEEEKLRKKIQEQAKEIESEKKKLKEQEKKLREKVKEIAEIQKNLREQDKKVGEQERKLQILERKQKEQERKLQIQERKQKEQEKDEKKKLGEQERVLEEQERKLAELQKKNEEQQKRLGEQEKKLEGQEKKFEFQEKKLLKILEFQQNQKQLEEKHDRKFKSLTSKIALCHHEAHVGLPKSIGLTQRAGLSMTFEMENFQSEKVKDKHDDWKSPAMYTGVCGYKFCVGVDANGRGFGRHFCISVTIWSLPGEFDGDLEWPAKIKFTVELLHPQKGCNIHHAITCDFNEPIAPREPLSWITRFLQHRQVEDYLNNNTLLFLVSDIEFL